MFMKNKIILFVLLFISLIISVNAQKQGSIKILALAEGEGNSTGAVADLSLELLDKGNERVILDTFPLSKLTTQISMRFAQQIACQELEFDCSNYDFFYTIKSIQGTVNGPSAGAAATILTASLLKDLEINKSVAITGTINSGGLIGPVGGIKQKIEAASKLGFKKVLIPKGTRTQKESQNNNDSVIIDLVDYGKNLSIEVIEVTTLNEALTHFNSNFLLEKLNQSIEEDQGYISIIKIISEDICNRTKGLLNKLNSSSEIQELINLTKKSDETINKENYYAASSYCFRTNILIKSKLLEQKNLTLVEIKDSLTNLAEELNKFDIETDNKTIETISDLQTFMAVSERIFEAKETWIKASQSLNDTKKATSLINYAQERLFSAKAWSKFFDWKDKNFVVSKNELRKSCENKISEAEERYNYVIDYFPDALKETRKEINIAYIFLKNESYVKCLYKATKAKAESDVILSLFGIDEKEVSQLLNVKLEVVKNSIIKTQKKGIFPIISYSYYEYANSLKENDIGNALLFSEYALEFSNLDIYFEKKKNLNDYLLKINKSYVKYLGIFIIGLIIGLLISIVFKSINKHKEWHDSVTSNNQFKTLQTSRKRRLRGKKR